jgi:acetyl esterase/lipase
VCDLVRATEPAVVFPYYTPTPDAHYPVQFDLGYAIIFYIAAHDSSLGLKTDKSAIAGNSVGGTTFLRSYFLLHKLQFLQCKWHLQSVLSL